MAENKGTLDYSQIDYGVIKLRGKRSAAFKLVPGVGEVIDPAIVKAVIGINGRIKKTLILNEGITDNTDGTFTVRVTPDDIEYTTGYIIEVYGLQGLPDQEIAYFEVEYTPVLK